MVITTWSASMGLPFASFWVGWGPTGIPRPLSATVISFVLWIQIDAVARSVHRLIDRVVEHLADEVVQAAQIRRPDVHAGSTTNCLEAFEHLDVARAVGRHRGRTALAPVAPRYVFPYGHLQTFPARTRIS